MTATPDSENAAADTAGTENAYPEIEYVVNEQAPQKRSLLRRIGCGVALIIWFAVLLLPTFFFILAVEGDITLRHRGDVPDKHQHPLLQVNLLMDADTRGLQLTNSSVDRGEDGLCIDTSVRYFLWQGEGENVRFCDCYIRNDADDSWNFDSTSPEACG